MKSVLFAVALGVLGALFLVLGWPSRCDGTRSKGFYPVREVRVKQHFSL